MLIEVAAIYLGDSFRDCRNMTHGVKTELCYQFFKPFGEFKVWPNGKFEFFYILSIKIIPLEKTIQFLLLHMSNFHCKLRVFVTADDLRSTPSKLLQDS